MGFRTSLISIYNMKDLIFLLAIIGFYIFYRNQWIEGNFKLFYFVFAFFLFFLYSLSIEIISSKIQGLKNKKKFTNFHDVEQIKKLCSNHFQAILKNRLDNHEYSISDSIQILFPKRDGLKNPPSSDFQYFTLESFTIFKLESINHQRIHRVFVEVYFSYYDRYHPVMTRPDDKLWVMEHWVFSLNPENIWVLVNTNLESSMFYHFRQWVQRIKELVFLK